MKNLVEFLKGKKTYIQAAIGAIVVGLGFAGVIDSAMVTTALGFLGLGISASLGAKIDRAAQR